MCKSFEYDIIVVGAGHAGCEAASVAATMGTKVLLVTADMNNIAQLSCNPAMGGIAKGQIVREIDALGGRSGLVTDACSIQFRMLNRSKGPAMWSPRAQLDRTRFIEAWRRELDGIDNLEIRQDRVTGLLIEQGAVCGVQTELWGDIRGARVVLTTGTFLNGLMHFGKTMLAGGRISEMASRGISEQLKAQGLRVDRMKTGTPARIDGRTVHFEEAVEQEGDKDFHAFSFLTMHENRLRKRSCHILYTNEACHAVLNAHLSESPLYNGQIQSIGPRYCPSIETKIVTFADKTRHQLFLEPEGEYTNEYYLNGFSSSLPLEVQLQALRSIPALRNVKLYRPGYAIEYDFFDPTQLKSTLESMVVKNLYLAGQVNGTTGYEEAGCQGLMAGINAALSLNTAPGELILQRDEAYIGVLIDDLVTKGVDEPYRMFTSRAEYRTILRQDTADERLTPYSIALGIASGERRELFSSKQASMKALTQFIQNYSVTPQQVNSMLSEAGESPLSQGTKLREVLLRPRINMSMLRAQLPELQQYMESLPYQAYDLSDTVETAIKYEGYIARERMEADKIRRLENIKLGDRFDYLSLDNISIESRQKLDRIKPMTIGQASRIPGVSPHDISVLLLLVGR